LRKGKEFLRCAAVACVDELADVGLAARNHATKRRSDALETFEFLQAAHVGFGRIHDGFFGGQIADGIVNFLLGDAIGFDKFLETRCRDTREIGVGLRSGQFSLRLRKLLVHFGRINVRQGFTCANASANVVIPLLT